MWCLLGLLMLEKSDDVIADFVLLGRGGGGVLKSPSFKLKDNSKEAMGVYNVFCILINVFGKRIAIQPSYKICA